MNFLQLTQRLGRECGVAGTGPSTVVGQTGEAGRLVNWIISAWDDIQMARPNWYWMTGDFTLTLVSGTREYSAADAGITARFGSWDIKSLRLYRQSKNDEIGLPWISYEDFRSSHLIGADSPAQPVDFTVSPRLGLMFGPMPDYGYTVNGEYLKANQTLALDADTPELPAQYHMAIVYRAMMMCARFEAAGEIFEDAEMNYKRIINRLEMNQMPGTDVSAPLV